MSKELIPLYYAIVKHFLGGKEDCAAGVIQALTPNYGSYKLLTSKDVEEALATAKENGILDETRCELDDEGQLRIFYRITQFGEEMITKYI